MHKRLLSVLVLLSVCLSLAGMSHAAAYAQAGAEIAMELTTGRVLTESNADKKMPMASTTKIMTAIIIIEDCSLDEVITVPDEAIGTEGSSIYLKKGEEIDVRDLLYGLMLRSGNDSAAALAIHHSGSTEAFAEVMCERAKKIGAENTSFKNPSGLPDPDHYTTARDLCKIACYAMKNEQFKEICSTKNYSGRYRSFVNKNKMLSICEGANGVKTGYTVNAGRCLVSSAERNGMDVVCVVLSCPDMYERSVAIIDGCFSRYALASISADKVFMRDDVLCKLANSANIVINKGEKIEYAVTPTDCAAEDEIGKIAGELKIYGQNGLLFSAKLYSIINE